MSSTFGKFFKVTTFGESHGSCYGTIIDGVPAGLILGEECIQNELNKRKPSVDLFSTSRLEEDRAEIVSGIFEGKTTGSPICVLVKNTKQNSHDYEATKNIYRPGHADETFDLKYGFRDFRGGGRSSGRETLSRVIAGAVAKKILLMKNIEIQTYLVRIGSVKAEEVDLNFAKVNPYRFADKKKISEIEEMLTRLKKDKDSVGALLETHVVNLPAGLGEPVFDKLDAVISHGVMSIGSVKGIEFGSGFQSAESFGSLNNDQFGQNTNKAGGILGGISNGKEIIFRCAIKPASSIGKTQMGKSRDGSLSQINLEGRFDVCIGPRVAVVVEAMTAISIVDLYLQNKLCRMEYL